MHSTEQGRASSCLIFSPKIAPCGAEVLPYLVGPTDTSSPGRGSSSSSELVLISAHW